MPLKNWVGTSARTGDHEKNKCSKIFMATTTIESELGSANRHQRSVGNVSSLASCQVCEAESGHYGEFSKHLRKFRVGTLSVNTERKSLWGSGNTIPQESGCLLYSGDQILQGHQVQALLVQKRLRHCWCRSVCGGKVDRESFWGAKSLWYNHLSEAYSQPACGYFSVCVYPTEWSEWWG